MVKEIVNDLITNYFHYFLLDSYTEGMTLLGTLQWCLLLKNFFQLQMLMFALEFEGRQKKYVHL